MEFFSTEDTDSENEGRFPCMYRSVLLAFFNFSGSVWLESMTASSIVIEVPIRSLVILIVWLASLLSVYKYLRRDSKYIVEYPKAVAPFSSRR